MTPTDLRHLRHELRRDAVARNLADFGAHLALKAPVSAVQYWVLPILFVLGVIDAVVLAAGVLFGESICRTLYTATRVVSCTLTRREAPWLALLVGTLPVVGITAFPIQMLFAGASSHRAVSRFIVYDTFASIGRAIPIWGGRDSLLEHHFNRIPSRFLRTPHGAREPVDGDRVIHAEEPAPTAGPSATDQ